MPNYFFLIHFYGFVCKYLSKIIRADFTNRHWKSGDPLSTLSHCTARKERRSVALVRGLQLPWPLWKKGGGPHWESRVIIPAHDLGGSDRAAILATILSDCQHRVIANPRRWLCGGAAAVATARPSWPGVHSGRPHPWSRSTRLPGRATRTGQLELRSWHEVQSIHGSCHDTLFKIMPRYQHFSNIFDEAFQAEKVLQPKM